MLHPQLEMIDETLSDQVQIVKVNVDENPDLVTQYGVMSVPHSRIIIDGEVSNPVVGFMPYEQLKKAIEKLL